MAGDLETLDLFAGPKSPPIHAPEERTPRSTSQEAGDDAVEAVGRSHGDWIQVEALPAIRRAGKALGRFTTDDVWAIITSTPLEPRAMGAAIREAKRRGWIRKTGSYLESKREACHGRPVPVWEWTAT